MVSTVDRSVDDDITRRLAKAGDGGVVADLELSGSVAEPYVPGLNSRAYRSGRTGSGPAGPQSRRRSPGSGSSTCSDRTAEHIIRPEVGPAARRSGRRTTMRAVQRWPRGRSTKKIGFLSFGHWSASPYSQVRSGSDALIQSIELAEAVEDLGADGAYFRVHHFAQQLASPFPLLAAIGARTKRIEIGTAVIDMRYENPLYMAEDAGAADLIAGGRLQLGISRGSPEQVIDGFRYFGYAPPTARPTPTWPASTPRSSSGPVGRRASPSPTHGPCSRTRRGCCAPSRIRPGCATGSGGAPDHARPRNGRPNRA